MPLRKTLRGGSPALSARPTSPATTGRRRSSRRAPPRSSASSFVGTRRFTRAAPVAVVPVDWDPLTTNAVVVGRTRGGAVIAPSMAPAVGARPAGIVPRAGSCGPRTRSRRCRHSALSGSRTDVCGARIQPGHEQLPVAGNALERVRAPGVESEIGSGDQIGDRAGDEHLVRGRVRADAAPRGGPRSRRCRSRAARPRRREGRCAREGRAPWLASRMASAQRIARAGPSKVASIPSPVPWMRRPR